MDAVSHYATITALLFFFAFFVGMTFWIFRPGMGEKLKRDGNIPFREDEL